MGPEWMPSNIQKMTGNRFPKYARNDRRSIRGDPRKKSTVPVVLVCSAAVLFGCGGGSDGGGDGGGGTGTGTALAGKATCTAEAGVGVVCGSVFAADGVTPLASSEVRLSNTSSASLSTKGVEDSTKCIADAAGAFACVVPAGTSGTTEFVVISGGFDNQSFTADVVQGATSDVGSVTMEASSAARWVVVPGLFDGVQVLLSQLKGCTLSDADGDPAFARASEECTSKGLLVLDDFEPTSETYVPTFLTSGSLASYDALFVNCDADWSATPGVDAAIQAFSTNGGHLYFSDLSDLWLESAFPGNITFGGNSTEAGPPAISGDVVDANLAAVVGTPIELVFDLPDWTVIDTVESFVTTFIQGDVTPLSNLVTGVRPITVGWTPSTASGCIFYTSYHVEGASTGAPQELAIKYLVQNASAVCN